MTAPTAKPSTWIPELAGYRAIAALAVFLFHVVSIDAPGGLVGRLTIPLGNAAVSLFFVLSGFLVYRPFADWAILDRAPVVTWRFIVRRLARILPLYWVVLTVHFLVTKPDNPLGIGEYLTSYLLVQNFRGSLVFLPPFVAWSLCIELWFSVALPFIAAPLRRAGRGRGLIERTQIQLLGLALVAGVSIVFRIWALNSPSDGRLLWMPAYLDWFAAGLVLAVLRSYWTERPPEIEVRQLAANPWLLSSLGLLSYWVVTQLGLPGAFVAPTRFQTHAQFSLQGLMSFLLVTAVVIPGADLGRARTFFASRPLQWLGAVSYGIYLIHPVITDELIEHFPTTPLGLIAAIAFAGTVLAAAVLHKTVEVPASRLADRLVLKKQQSIEPNHPSVAAAARTERELPARRQPMRPPASRAEAASSPWTQSLIIASLAFASPLLSLPNRYVGDSRFELTYAPTARFERMFVGWDSARGLGRPAEEFWPLLTFLSDGLNGLGVAPWILQRLIHGLLLALAGIGMILLARALDRGRSHAPLLAALLYAFGPASSLYLLPVPLYTSYAAAPWLAFAVLKASQRDPMRWAGVIAVVVFLVGNADPPGLVLACLPAASIWLVLMVSRSDVRHRLSGFAAAAFAFTVLVSAAMLTKTMIGSAALAHRLAETESVAAVASSSSFSESLRGAGFWLLYFRLEPGNFREHLDLFIANGWVVFATIIPLTVGIAGMSRRSNQTHLLALGWVLIGVVAMVGPFPTDNPTPWGRALVELFAASDGAFAFRSSHKAGVILAMGVSLLAAWALEDLGRAVAKREQGTVTVIAIGAAATVLATITAPFWTTPLYADSVSNAAIPVYWSDAADQLRAEADGRVLVIPGSTNNGYRWGAIGDDLIDALVPSPVVATTLPLSTPLPADIVDALNDAVTSPDYQHGTLAPIARRLGITHLVIRNDLAWEVQGLPRPSDLDGVRTDPDLTLVGRHGAEGRFVVSPFNPNEEELALPPVEIYRIESATPPTMVVLPDEGVPRTVLVDGTGAALVRVAAEGLLDHGHIVRFASAITSPNDELDDVALVVITGTTRSVERRIGYYDYRFARADDPSKANGWLGLDGPGDLTTVQLDGATATSTVDRWLLGVDHQPFHAFDGDPATTWLVPRIIQSTFQQLAITFDNPVVIAGATIELVDDDQRITELTVSADGVPVTTERVGDLLTLGFDELGSAPVETLTIELGEFEPGFSAVGIADVHFDIERSDPTRVTTSVPSQAADGVADGVPALFLLGPDQPSSSAFTADIITWRDDQHRLTVTLESELTTARCEPILELDGVPVSMVIRPNGDGTGTAEPCRGPDALTITPGQHRITIIPLPGDRLVGMRLTSGSLDLAPVTRVGVEDATALGTGDIIVLPHSVDAGWSLDNVGDSGVRASTVPFAADGLAAFSIEQGSGPPGTSRIVVAHAADRLVDQAWLVTVSGLGITLLAVALGRSPQQTQSSVRNARRTARSSRALTVAPPAVALLGAWLFAGPLAIIGVAAGWALEQRRPRSAFMAVATGLVAVTAYRVWPLLASGVDFIDPARGDQATRVVVGMLIMATASAVRRLQPHQ